MSDMPETTVVSEARTDRNPVVIVLAVVAALVAGALVWFFVVTPLLLGDDAEDGDAVAVSAAQTDPATDVADAPTTEQPLEEPLDGAEQLPIVTYEVFLDRDPFEPVVPEPVAATATTGTATGGAVGDTTDGSGGTTDTTGGTTDTTGGTTDGTTGSTDGTTGGTTGGTTSGCTSGDQIVCDGRVVSLIDVRTGDDGEPVAIVQVDTTVYEVGVGETFAGSFRVQSISGGQVYLLYGDDAFGLREGDRVLK